MKNPCTNHFSFINRKVIFKMPRLRTVNKRQENIDKSQQGLEQFKRIKSSAQSSENCRNWPKTWISDNKPPYSYSLTTNWNH